MLTPGEPNIGAQSVTPNVVLLIDVPPVIPEPERVPPSRRSSQVGITGVPLEYSG